MDMSEKWETALRDAQLVTKIFTHGKEHQGLIELVDVINEENVGPECADSDTLDESIKFLNPSLRSSLKFAAHGHKFLKNYVNNLPIYIKALNKAQNDNNHTNKQKDTLLAALKKITLEHVTIVVGLMDYYHVLAKAQHGASTVNQLCWEFYDKVEVLRDTLENMSKGELDKWPNLKHCLNSLEISEIQNVPIATEMPKQTRQHTANDSEHDPIENNRKIISSARKVLGKVCSTMKEQLHERIVIPDLINTIKKAFFKWESTELQKLIQISAKSGRYYGNKTTLMDEYFILQNSYLLKKWEKDTPEVEKWLYMCNHEQFYLGCENIIHFALCCFSKSPVESIVESVGSTINYHGNKSRSSLSHQSLNDEINVVWNGPEEFSPDAQAIIKASLHDYFPDTIHFYANHRNSFASSTVANVINKPSRISRHS